MLWQTHSWCPWCRTYCDDDRCVDESDAVYRTYCDDDRCVEGDAVCCGRPIPGVPGAGRHQGAGGQSGVLSHHPG